MLYYVCFEQKNQTSHTWKGDLQPTEEKLGFCFFTRPLRLFRGWGCFHLRLRRRRSFIEPQRPLAAIGASTAGRQSQMAKTKETCQKLCLYQNCCDLLTLHFFIKFVSQAYSSNTYPPSEWTRKQIVQPLKSFWNKPPSNPTTFE